MLRSNAKSRLLILLPSQFLESLNGDFHQMEMQYPELAEHGYFHQILKIQMEAKGFFLDK